MGTSKEQLAAWFDEGKAKGATHMIVVCDTYDHEDYPVFIMPGESIREKYQRYADGKESMQRVMEVYSLGKDKESQLSEYRAFHFD